MTDPIAPGVAAVLEGVRKTFENEHPLFAALHPRPLRFGRGEVAVEMTPTETFIDNGAIHSGLMTIILDTMLGIVTWTMLDEFIPLATINLQTDTYDHAMPGQKIICEALCEGIADDVSITRGKATSEDGSLIATAAGTFMVGTRSAQVSRI